MLKELEEIIDYINKNKVFGEDNDRAVEVLNDALKIVKSTVIEDSIKKETM